MDKKVQSFVKSTEMGKKYRGNIKKIHQETSVQQKLIILYPIKNKIICIFLRLVFICFLKAAVRFKYSHI